MVHRFQSGHEKLASREAGNVARDHRLLLYFHQRGILSESEGKFFQMGPSNPGNRDRMRIMGDGGQRKATSGPDNFRASY
jgi:hypothetical protein